MSFKGEEGNGRKRRPLKPVRVEEQFTACPQHPLQDAVEDFEHGYYNDAATKLLPIIEQGRKTGNLNPQLLEFLAVIWGTQGKFSEAEEAFEEAGKIMKKAKPLSECNASIRLLNSTAGLYRIWGQFEKAAKLYNKALSLLEMPENCDAEFVRLHVLCNLSELNIHRGRFAEAESLIAEAKKLNDKNSNYEVSHILDYNSALLLLALGRSEEAESLLRKVVEKFEVTNHDLPTILNSLGIACTRLAKFEDAKSIFRRVLSLNESMLGANHPSVASTCNLLAEVLLVEGKHEEAEALCKRALSIISQNFGLDHEFASDVFVNMVTAKSELGAFTDSDALQNWAISNLQGTMGAPSRQHCRIYHRIAINFHRRRDYRTAIPFYLQTLDLSKKIYGLDHPQTVITMVNMAHCNFQMAQYGLADEMSAEAAKLLFEFQAPMKERVMIESLETLADLRHAFKDFEAASRIYKIAMELDSQLESVSKMESVSRSADLVAVELAAAMDFSVTENSGQAMFIHSNESFAPVEVPSPELLVWTMTHGHNPGYLLSSGPTI